MSTPAETPVKSMKGKYDGRKKNGANLRKALNAGKPAWAKHLSRNTAAKLFVKLDMAGMLLQLMDTEDERLRFEIIRYIWDRYEGKPFVATNPNEIKQPNVMIDARVQTALQQYVVDPKQVRMLPAEIVTPTQAAAKPGEGEEN